MADIGVNTVYLHVRPFGDAVYETDLAPWSHVLYKNDKMVEGVDPGYDLLEIMAEEARRYGMRVEAWINPFRIRASGSTIGLSSSNPAWDYINAGSRTVIQYDGGIYYNPAKSESADILSEIVIELLENYDIDGIHFDDYFYPTTDKAFDSVEYNAYLNSGGSLPLEDWRRDNVSKFVSEIYDAVKSVDDRLTFGISPAGNIEYNYGYQYVDAEMWCQNDGYIDYIMPQVYFGFHNAAQPFAENVAEWNSYTYGSDTKLIVGLAAYKIGLADGGGGSQGTVGRHEWENNVDLLERMVYESRDQSGYAGIALYRYDSLFNPVNSVAWYVSEELDNLENAIN